MRNVIFISQNGLALSKLQNPNLHQIDMNFQILFSNVFRDSIIIAQGIQNSKYEFITAITIENGEILESVRYGNLVPISNLESVIILNSKMQILKLLVNPNPEYVANYVERMLTKNTQNTATESFLTVAYLRNGFVVRSAKYRNY